MQFGTFGNVHARFALSVVVHKVSFGIDQINDDCMVDNVIFIVISGSSAIVDPVRFASFLDLGVIPCQTDDVGIEFLNVFFDNLGLIKNSRY